MPVVLIFGWETWDTEHGFYEDPHLMGKIKILEAKKCDEKDVYFLKVKFEKEEDD